MRPLYLPGTTPYRCVCCDAPLEAAFRLGSEIAGREAEAADDYAWPLAAAQTATVSARALQTR